MGFEFAHRLFEVHLNSHICVCEFVTWAFSPPMMKKNGKGAGRGSLISYLIWSVSTTPSFRFSSVYSLTFSDFKVSFRSTFNSSNPAII